MHPLLRAFPPTPESESESGSGSESAPRTQALKVLSLLLLLSLFLLLLPPCEQHLTMIHFYLYSHLQRQWKKKKKTSSMMDSNFYNSVLNSAPNPLLRRPIRTQLGASRPIEKLKLNSLALLPLPLPLVSYSSIRKGAESRKKKFCVPVWLIFVTIWLHPNEFFFYCLGGNHLQYLTL